MGGGPGGWGGSKLTMGCAGQNFQQLGNLARSVEGWASQGHLHPATPQPGGRAALGGAAGSGRRIPAQAVQLVETARGEVSVQFKAGCRNDSPARAGGAGTFVKPWAQLCADGPPRGVSFHLRRPGETGADDAGQRAGAGMKCRGCVGWHQVKGIGFWQGRRSQRQGAGGRAGGKYPQPCWVVA